jgi:hypothetical protein
MCRVSLRTNVGQQCHLSDMLFDASATGNTSRIPERDRPPAGHRRASRSSPSRRECLLAGDHRSWRASAVGQGTACRFGRGSQDHLADDVAVTEPSLPRLPLLIVEDPLLVLLPEALVRIEGHLDVEEGPQLAQLQLALRPLGLEDAGEVGVVEYQTFVQEGSVDRAVVGISLGGSVGLPQLHHQPEQTGDGQDLDERPGQVEERKVRNSGCACRSSQPGSHLRGKWASGGEADLPVPEESYPASCDPRLCGRRRRCERNAQRPSRCPPSTAPVVRQTRLSHLANSTGTDS